MKTLLAVALVLGIAAELALSQSNPFNRKMPSSIKNIMSPSIRTFGKGPPNPSLKPSTALDPDRLKLIREFLSGGKSFSIHECNLKRVTPFKDPSIKRTGNPSRSNQNTGIPQAVLNMAIQRAERRGSSEAKALKAIQQSNRRVQASIARGKAADKARAVNRTKRQAGSEMVFMAESVTSSMCQARERRIVTVVNDGDTCYTDSSQEVKYWECASNYASGMTNPYPSMQDYFCEPDNYVYTSWYVVCPTAKNFDRRVRIQTAHVPINCACVRYKCNFEPYQSDVALDF